MKRILIVHYKASDKIPKIVSSARESGVSIRIFCGEHPLLSRMAKNLADELGVSYLPTILLDVEDVPNFEYEGFSLIERTGSDLIIIVSRINFCSALRYYVYRKILMKELYLGVLFLGGGACEIDLRTGEEKFL